MPVRQPVPLIAAVLAACPAHDAAMGQFQDSRPTATSDREFNNGRYRLRMPDGWRRLTPDEGRRVRRVLPGDMQDLPVPGQFDRLGDIDSWLAGKFDGRCVTIGMLEGEAPLEEKAGALARIRDSLAKRHEGTGLRYTWLGGKRTGVGPREHPAFEASMAIQPKREGRPMQILELYVPTGGYTVTIQFRAFASDYHAAEPVFRGIIDTLEFARDPTGPDELTDRLQFAAIVGAIVGLILLVLYKWTRR